MKLIRGARVTPAKEQAAKDMREQMTAEEATLWQALKANQLGGMHFRRQQVIEGFIADFYCHAARLVVEVDGGIHRKRQQYDLERDQVLAAQRLQVLRIPNARVRDDLPGALEDIKGAAASRQ